MAAGSPPQGSSPPASGAYRRCGLDCRNKRVAARLRPAAADRRRKHKRMRPQALGYVGFRAGDLSEWRAYGTRHLGLQLVDRSSGSVAFRMDDRKQRVVVEADG